MDNISVYCLAMKPEYTKKFLNSIIPILAYQRTTELILGEFAKFLPDILILTQTKQGILDQQVIKNFYKFIQIIIQKQSLFTAQQLAISIKNNMTPEFFNMQQLRQIMNELQQQNMEFFIKRLFVSSLITYNVLNKIEEQYSQFITKYITDQESQIRKQTALELLEIATNIKQSRLNDEEQQKLIHFVASAFIRTSIDLNDCVRECNIQTGFILLQLSQNPLFEKQIDLSDILKTIIKQVNDKSYVVRKIIAEKLTIIIDIAGEFIDKTEFAHLIKIMIEDNEESVKISVLNQIDKILNMLQEQQLVSILLPSLSAYITNNHDSSFQLKKAFINKWDTIYRKIPRDQTKSIATIQQIFQDTIKMLLLQGDVQTRSLTYRRINILVYWNEDLYLKYISNCLTIKQKYQDVEGALQSLYDYCEQKTQRYQEIYNSIENVIIQYIDEKYSCIQREGERFIKQQLKYLNNTQKQKVLQYLINLLKNDATRQLSKIYILHILFFQLQQYLEQNDDQSQDLLDKININFEYINYKQVSQEIFQLIQNLIEDSAENDFNIQLVSEQLNQLLDQILDQYSEYQQTITELQENIQQVIE